jgi:tetratricopeptide (TPR) repeat protein
MRYPGLEPVGSGPAASGWALAGTDLAEAERVLRRQGTETIELIEVLRRRGCLPQAAQVLQAARRAGPEHVLLTFAEANLRWNESDLQRAKACYSAAFHAWDQAGNQDGRLAAQLGYARCERITVGRTERSTLDAAQRTAAEVHDEDLLADLQRERAAWALIDGEQDAARRLAGGASETHRRTGDLYLAGQADVLVARAWNAGGDENRAIALLQEVRERSVEIGSVDLRLLSVVFLGQILQRGAAPDSDRWQAAEAMLAEEVDGAHDPITRAEILLPLAHLHLAAGAFDQAADELDEYMELYTAAGGNRVSTGNYYKARARLALARGGGGGVIRSVRHTPRLIAAVGAARRDLRRAARSYRDAGLEPGRRSIEWHIGVLDLMAAGRPLKRRASADVANQFDMALEKLVQGERFRTTGRWKAARAAYVEAESRAIACEATAMAVAATACRAEAAYAAGAADEALDAIRSMLRHSEAIRGAVSQGSARGNVGLVARSNYERAAVLAARLGDADLALELVERLRTERLAGLLRSDSQALPDDVRELLAEIDRASSALLGAMPGATVVRSVRSAEVEGAWTGLSADALTERLEFLYAELGRRTSDLFASAVGAVPVDWEAIAAVTQDVLALVTVPDDTGDVVIAVWRSSEGKTAVAVTEVDEDLLLLRDTLVRPGSQGLVDRVGLTASDLHAVGRLLPPELAAALGNASSPVRLVIVPTSWMWAVPFAGVPIGGEGAGLLIDRADIVLAPSIRFFIELAGRRAAGAEHGTGAVSWQAPGSGIVAPEVDALRHHGGETVELSSAAEVREAFVRGGHRYRTAVLAAHGNRKPGMAQAVLDGDRPVLSASDYLDGERMPPRFLSLASCHSGYPGGDDPHEPLGLALAALTAGVQQVVSSSFEMDAYEGPATDCLRRLYTELAHNSDVPAVLCRILREGRHNEEPLYRWAVLSVIGAPEG